MVIIPKVKLINSLFSMPFRGGILLTLYPSTRDYYCYYYKIKLIYWNATTMYTHKLKVDGRVSFIDDIEVKVKNTITSTNAILSNTGECYLKLKLCDNSDHIKLTGN